MARYTLTISPDYVKNWTIADAVRELVQNWIDQETLDNENEKSMIITDDSLVLSNRTSVLDKSTLLLGGGTKDGTETIGQFGEGYKVAMLVLMREKVTCQIRNYGLNELWIPRIVNSRIYGSEVLAIDTKEYVRKKNNMDSLEIHLYNIPGIKDILSNIWLNFEDRKYGHIKCDSGEILTDPSLKGHIYIKGLLITNRSNLSYGYNFNPNMIKVGRDRNIVSGSDLEAASSKLWLQELSNGKNHYDSVYSMIESKARDISDIWEFQYPNDFKDFVSDKYEGKFVIAYDSDKQAIYDTFGDVETTIVPYIIKEMIHSKSLSMGVPIRVKTTKDLLREFIDRNTDLTTSHIEELEFIIKGD